MEQTIYKVYAKLDVHNCIIGVESTGFHSEQELIDKGYILIDEGTDWHTHYHCQPNYIQDTFGKPMYDENDKPNFILENGVIRELSEEEKAILYPLVEPQPTFEELQNEVNIDVDYRLSCLELGV